jgi:hypothetical protein
MEVIRVATGLPVAALLPLSLPRVRESRRLAILISAGYASVVLAPIFPGWQSWSLIILTAGISAGARHEASRNPDWVAQVQTKDRTASWRDSLHQTVPLLAGAALALAASLLLGAEEARRAVGSVLLDNHVILITTGVLAAVFVGGIVVSFILSPFSELLKGTDEDLPSLRNAGTYIGWFERALLFAFVLGGQPEAAALALAAKGFARFPSLKEGHERFAEYFLLGTLSSITVALAAAVATRAALGLKIL